MLSAAYIKRSNRNPPVPNHRRACPHVASAASHATAAAAAGIDMLPRGRACEVRIPLFFVRRWDCHGAAPRPDVFA